jgi:probable rRNA maturation factor
MIVEKKSKIRFFSNDLRPNLKNVRRLKQFIELIFKKERRPIDYINYIFCSDKDLLSLNRTFLDHDFYTDVITFDLSSGKKKVSAEIYISLDRVRDNAKQMGVPLKSEIHRVIFHGALHLCGYNDKSKGDLAVMRKEEQKLLSKYFNP